MKNQTVKIQKNDGYVFNTVSKQLEKYEFISCKFNFIKNEIQYKCRLGGVEKIIEDNNLKVYASESDYKKDTPLGFCERFFNDAMHCAYGFTPQWNDGKPYAWEYKNGDATQVDISDITFSTNNNWEFEKDDSRQIYESHSRVFCFHDLIVKEGDGSIKVRKSPASRLLPNDEQKALIEELQSVLQKLTSADMKLMYNTDNVKLYAVPMGGIQDLKTWDDGEEANIQIQDMITEIKSEGVLSYIPDDGGPLAIFKE